VNLRTPVYESHANSSHLMFTANQSLFEIRQKPIHKYTHTGMQKTQPQYWVGQKTGATLFYGL